MTKPKENKPTITIENCNIQNTAAPISDNAAAALLEAAKAATANAQAIGKIADALKGVEARMDCGIRVDGF